MIEQIILDYLEKNLSISTYLEEPESKPDKYLIVEVNGGGDNNFINSAMIIVQSYAPSRHEAAKLNELVKEKMKCIIELDSIIKVQLNADYNYTDVKKKRPRYQAVFDITYY